MDLLDGERTVFEDLDYTFPQAGQGQLRTLAGCFGFSGDDVEKRCRVLSGGEKARLVMAKMLFDPPNFLVLDEPTTGLDPSQRESLLDRIRVLSTQKGKSVLLSTHILHDVQRVCDQVIILVRGQVRLVDSMSNLQRPSQATLFVQVVAEAARLQNALESSGIQSDLAGPQELLVRGDRVDTARVWAASRECQVLIQRIEPARNSLEQTFLDAVKGG